MYKHDHTKHLAAAALCALALLGGRAAQAQLATQLTAPAQLGPGASVAQYPSNPTLASSFILPSFGTTLTFTSMPEPTGATAFQTFVNQPNPFTGQPSLDTNAFPNGTTLIDTFDPNTMTPTGPIQISFSTGVNEFGLFGQSAGTDTYHFNFSVFGGPNGTVPLGSFTTADVLNTIGSGPTGGGNATFVGAQALAGNLITKVILSDTSNTTATNDFYFGPLSYQFSAPVPESSTAVGFGMGTLLFVGLIVTAQKRKASASREPRSRPQVSRPLERRLPCQVSESGPWEALPVLAFERVLNIIEPSFHKHDRRSPASSQG